MQFSYRPSSNLVYHMIARFDTHDYLYGYCVVTCDQAMLLLILLKSNDSDSCLVAIRLLSLWMLILGRDLSSSCCVTVML